MARSIRPITSFSNLCPHPQKALQIRLPRATQSQKSRTLTISNKSILTHTNMPVRPQHAPDQGTIWMRSWTVVTSNLLWVTSFSQPRFQSLADEPTYPKFTRDPEKAMGTASTFDLTGILVWKMRAIPPPASTNLWWKMPSNTAPSVHSFHNSASPFMKRQTNTLLYLLRIMVLVFTLRYLYKI